MNLTKTCAKCNITKPLTDYYTQHCHSNGVMSYCKKCFNRNCQDRWVQRKIDAVKYKGGACIDCGLTLEQSCYAVFDFHHNDPSTKEGNWKSIRQKAWSTIIRELDKCSLLCANCHRTRHALQEEKKILQA